MMGEFRAYLIEYWGYVSAYYTRGKALMNALVGVAGALALFGLQSIVPALPAWAAPSWLGLWIFLGLITTPYRMWKDQRFQIASMRIPSAPFPDWPIKSAFEHIAGEVDVLKEEHWKTVGRILRDKLSTGQLTAWGRPHKGAPLVRIDQGYWRDADWSYQWFFPDDGEDHVHVWKLLGLGDEPYHDVQFHRASALRIWPANGTKDQIKSG